MNVKCVLCRYIQLHRESPSSALTPCLICGHLIAMYLADFLDSKEPQ